MILSCVMPLLCLQCLLCHGFALCLAALVAKNVKLTQGLASRLRAGLGVPGWIERLVLTDYVLLLRLLLYSSPDGRA